MNKKQWKTLDIQVGVEGDNELTLGKTDQTRREYPRRGNDSYKSRQGSGRFQSYRDRGDRDRGDRDRGDRGGDRDRDRDRGERDNTEANWRTTPRRTQQPFPESSTQGSSTRPWHDNNNSRSFRDSKSSGGSDGPRSFRDSKASGGSDGPRSFRDSKALGSDGPRPFRDSKAPGSDGFRSFRDPKPSGSEGSSSKFFGQGTGGLADLARKTLTPVNSTRFSRPLEAEVRKVEPLSTTTQPREDAAAKTQDTEKRDTGKEKKPQIEPTEEEKERAEPENESQQKQKPKPKAKQKQEQETEQEQEAEQEQGQEQEKNNNKNKKPQANDKAKAKERKQKQKKFMKCLEDKKVISDIETIRYGLEHPNLKNDEFIGEKVGFLLAKTLDNCKSITLMQLLALTLELQPQSFLEIMLEILSNLESSHSPLYLIELTNKQKLISWLRTKESVWAPTDKAMKQALTEFKEYGLQYLFPVKTSVIEQLSTFESLSELTQHLKTIGKQKQYFCNFETLRIISNVCGTQLFASQDNAAILPQVFECLKIVCSNATKGVSAEIEGCLGHSVYLIELLVEKSYANNRVNSNLLPLLQRLVDSKVVSRQDVDVWRNDVTTMSDAKRESFKLLADWLFELETKELDKENEEETAKDTVRDVEANESENEEEPENRTQDVDSGGYDQIDLLQENPNVKGKGN